MSRKVATLVYAKQAGSMARKAVLAYFADRANDDGSGIWTAKQRIADEIECSKQTVITTVKALLADGLISETGRRPNGNGYTVEYTINLAAVEALPVSKRDVEGVQILTGQELDGSTSLTARGQAALPKPSMNRPNQKKASPPSGARARATAVPTNFLPEPKAGSITAKAMAAWPPGEVEEQVEHFVDHHTAKGTVSKDWQASWRTWVKNWKAFNGNRTGRIPARQSDLRGSRPQPALDMLRASQRAQAAAGAPGYRGDREQAGTALPALWSG